MNTKEWLLSIAQEVEDDPARWTTLSFARDEVGISVYPLSQRAKCWCAAGFQYRDSNFSATPALVKACGEDHALYNDSLESPEQFVSWFRKAAEMCE
jgi:hypothetical protein